MGGHSSGSDSDSGSDKEHSKKDKKDKHDKKDKKDKHDKGDKHDKHDKEDKHKDEKHHESSSHGGGLSGHLSGILPGHEKYTGKLKKEDVHDLKHRQDISEEERAHRKKILMAEVAAGVVGAGALGFAGYQAYQHFNKDDEQKPGEHVKDA